MIRQFRLLMTDILMTGCYVLREVRNVYLKNKMVFIYYQIQHMTTSLSTGFTILHSTYMFSFYSTTQIKVDHMTPKKKSRLGLRPTGMFLCAASVSNYFILSLSLGNGWKRLVMSNELPIPIHLLSPPLPTQTYKHY